MTLEEMEAAIEAKAAPSKPTTVITPRFAHEVRMRLSDMEPWVIEQLGAKQCPTCGSEMTVLCSSQNGVTFYTCTDAPSLHRWTVIDPKPETTRWEGM
jgi:hypothetical protein